MLHRQLPPCISQLLFKILNSTYGISILGIITLIIWNQAGGPKVDGVGDRRVARKGLLTHVGGDCFAESELLTMPGVQGG